MNQIPDKKPGSISKAIAQLGTHDEQAAQVLWEAFFERLCGFAQTKIFPRHKRLFDGDDVAASALFALIDGARNDRFERPGNRDEFWQLLVVIASNKAANKRNYYDRQKRGGGKVRGDSAFEPMGIDSVVDYVKRDGDPQVMVELEEQCDEMLRRLPDDGIRKIALMRLAGYSNEEMAAEIDCAERTIERKLQIIRKVWSSLDE